MLSTYIKKCINIIYIKGRRVEGKGEKRENSMIVVHGDGRTKKREERGGDSGVEINIKSQS